MRTRNGRTHRLIHNRKRMKALQQRKFSQLLDESREIQDLLHLIEKILDNIEEIVKFVGKHEDELTGLYNRVSSLERKIKMDPELRTILNKLSESNKFVVKKRNEKRTI